MRREYIPSLPVRRAVFLDRDDTLIRRRGGAPTGDLGNPADAELMPGAAEACAALRAAGFTLVVFTNQGGVARGSHTMADVERVHEWLNGALGGVIGAFRACPFHPLGTVPGYRREHTWRKPSPGMILDAAEELGIDLASSWVVGDSERDCEAGRAAGCRTALVRSGVGAAPASADHVVSTIEEAAALIVSRARSAEA